MRHSQPKSSSRTSTKQRTIRGRRPHRLVRRPQHSRTYGQRAVHRPERRGTHAQRLGRTPSRSSLRRRDQDEVTEVFKRGIREKTHRSRERKDFLKTAKEETSHRNYPTKSSKKRKIRELNRILDQLSSEIEEQIRECKKDQLSRIFSRDIPETPPAQPETKK